MVARASVGVVEPGRLEPGLDRRADRDAGAARGRARVGQEAARRAEPCALVFFGDGATSEGAFHEGVNLAAVMNAPLVLVCNNNQWAISTPLEAQTRGRDARRQGGRLRHARRARSTALDVLAVYEAAREAVERARAGGGPTLIEAVHYRAAPHATADDPRAYIDLERVEEERARRVRRPLRGATCARLGVLTDERADAMRERGARS